MGYPLAKSSGSSLGTSSGLSYVTGAAPSAINSVGQLFKVPLAIPANDLTSLARKTGLLRRAFPWLGAALTAYELYTLWQARNQNPLSGLFDFCGGGGIWGPLLGHAVCNSDEYPEIAPRGVYREVGSGYRIARWHYDNEPPQGSISKGRVAQSTQLVQFEPYTSRWIDVGVPVAPFFVPPFDPLTDPFFDPWSNPIGNPGRVTNPVPWPVIPYKPRPRAPGDPIPQPLPRPLPGEPGHPPEPDSPGEPGPDTPPLFPRPRPRFPRQRPQQRNNRQQRPRQRGRSDFMRDPRFEIRPSQAYRLKPPGPRVREKKSQQLGATAGLMWAAFNGVTEFRDLVDSFHKALPDHLKTKTFRTGAGKFTSAKAPTLQKKLEELYSGFRKMNDDEYTDFLNKAIDNLITDQIKDHVFGKLGAGIGQGSGQLGRPIGFSAGPAL